MFMMSIKLSRKRMLIGCLAVALVIALGITGARYLGAKETAVNAAKPSDEASAEKINVKKAPAKTNDQRLEFIESFGWEVVPEPAEILEVIIPAEFDEVYKEYNSLQKLQGCDLGSLAGKRCKRYSYEVLNYPGQEESVRVNILVQNNKVVGGDVCSLEENGFIHGFAHP